MHLNHCPRARIFAVSNPQDGPHFRERYGKPGNYYEQIIRTESSLDEIRRYLLDNPAQWSNDENNPLKWLVAATRAAPTGYRIMNLPHNNPGGLARNYALTALGMVNALGQDTTTLWKRILQGDSSGLVLESGYLPQRTVRVGKAAGGVAGDFRRRCQARMCVGIMR